MMLDTLHTRQAPQQSFSLEERKKIVEENMGLVGSIVKRFSATGHDMEDLFQIGCVGLVKAVERFDVRIGVKLSTYAVPVILGEIKRYLRDDGAVRISRSIKTNAMHIRTYIEQCEKENGAVPTISEIATHLHLETEDVLLAMDAARPIQYLQADEEESGFSLMETLCAPDTEEHILNRIALREAIEILPIRDRKILTLRYYQNKTQAQVAELLSISQVQVSRLEKKLLATLRTKLLEEH